MPASPPSVPPPSTDTLPAPLRTLAARGEPRRYRKGMHLIQEGDHSDTQFILLAGRVKAYSIDEVRDREIVYGVYGPGEYIGEMSLDGGPRSASVIALEATVCVIVTRQTLREHIAADPEFAFELLARVIRRARLATESARNMALLDVYGRLIKLIDTMAVTQADGVRLVPERLKQREIASRVGCSREMVSRLMKDLETGGYVVAWERGWVIRRPPPPRW
jgi:CRP/FNR family transcriptional regulator, cyclic AMP receptor protein